MSALRTIEEIRAAIATRKGREIPRGLMDDALEGLWCIIANEGRTHADVRNVAMVLLSLDGLAQKEQLAAAEWARSDAGKPSAIVGHVELRARFADGPELVPLGGRLEHLGGNGNGNGNGNGHNGNGHGPN